MSDDDGRFGLTRRRLLGAVATTGVAASTAGAGTWAYLGDTERSAGNSVEAGTLDLTLSDGGTLTYEVLGVAPGDGTIARKSLDLNNVGSTPADHVEIDVRNEPLEDDDGDPSNGFGSGPESDASPSSAAGMAKWVEVERLDYARRDGSVVDLKAQLSNENDTPFVDLDDLAAPANEDVLDDLQPPAADGGTGTEFDIDVSLHPDTPNDYQGDVLRTTVSFALHQDASQDA